MLNSDQIASVYCLISGIFSILFLLRKKLEERRLGIRASRGRHIFTIVVVLACCSVYVFGGVLPWYFHEHKSKQFRSLLGMANYALNTRKYDLAQDMGFQALNYAESTGLETTQRIAALVLIGGAAGKANNQSTVEHVAGRLADIVEVDYSKTLRTQDRNDLSNISQFCNDNLSTASGRLAMRLRKDISGIGSL